MNVVLQFIVGFHTGTSVTPRDMPYKADFTNEDEEGSMGVWKLSMGLSGTFEVRGNRGISRKGETLTGCVGVCTQSHDVGS